VDVSKYFPVYDFFRDIYYRRTGQDIPLPCSNSGSTSTTGMFSYKYQQWSTTLTGMAGPGGVTGNIGHPSNCGDPYCTACSNLIGRVLSTGSTGATAVVVVV
jgi:hypothetical protein